jgi:hypothetical protein
MPKPSDEILFRNVELQEKHPLLQIRNFFSRLQA